jgi:hypothetical protein
VAAVAALVAFSPHSPITTRYVAVEWFVNIAQASGASTMTDSVAWHLIRGWSIRRSASAHPICHRDIAASGAQIFKRSVPQQI